MPGYSPPHRRADRVRKKTRSKNGSKNGSGSDSSSSSSSGPPTRQSHHSCPTPTGPLSPVSEESPPTELTPASTPTATAAASTGRPRALSWDSALSLATTAETPSPVTPFFMTSTQSTAPRDVEEEVAEPDSPTPDSGQLPKYPYSHYRLETKNTTTTAAPSTATPTRRPLAGHGAGTGLGIRFGPDSALYPAPSLTVTSSDTITNSSSPPASSASDSPETPPSAARIQSESRPYPITACRRAFGGTESARSTDTLEPATSVEVREVSSPGSPGSPSEMHPPIDFSAPPATPFEPETGSELSPTATILQTPIVTLRPAPTDDTPSPAHEVIYPTQEDFESEPSPSTSPRSQGKRKATAIVHAITTSDEDDEKDEQEPKRSKGETAWTPRPMLLPESPNGPSDLGDMTAEEVSASAKHPSDLSVSSDRELLPAVELAWSSASPTTSEMGSDSLELTSQARQGGEEMERKDSGSSDETIKPKSRTRSASPDDPFDLEEGLSKSEFEDPDTRPGPLSPLFTPPPLDPPMDVSEWYDSPEEDEENEENEEDEDPFDLEKEESAEDKDQTIVMLREVNNRLLSEREWFQAEINTAWARLEASFQFADELVKQIDIDTVLYHLASFGGLFRSTDQELALFRETLAQLGAAVSSSKPASAKQWPSPEIYPYVAETLTRSFQIVFNGYDASEVEERIDRREDQQFLPFDELWLFLNTADIELLAIAQWALVLLEHACLGTRRGIVVSLCLSRIEGAKLTYRGAHIAKYKLWSKRQRLHYDLNHRRLAELPRGESPEQVSETLGKMDRFECDLKRGTWYEVQMLIERDIMPTVRQRKRVTATASRSERLVIE
ncbi:hypothetical protein IAU59_006513 [Kwoniella sp. CBS 9459]